MVELLKLGQVRHEKVRDDLLNIRSLFMRGRIELKRQGNWVGGPKAKLLALCSWYWTQNQCEVCAKTPQQSFSHRIERITRQHGVVIGVLATVYLMAYRTIHREK